MTDTYIPRGTEGRVYGGLRDKVHIRDGQRGAFGVRVADFIDAEMRAGDDDAGDKPLCPGCYMIAILGTTITLAQRNGQSLAELGCAMAYAYTQLAERAKADLPEEMLILPFADKQALALVRSR